MKRILAFGLLIVLFVSMVGCRRQEKAKEDIFRLVWGTRLVVGDRTIDVHIRKIREKIGEGYIVTVKGVGYKFVEKQ